MSHLSWTFDIFCFHAVPSLILRLEVLFSDRPLLYRTVASLCMLSLFVPPITKKHTITYKKPNILIVFSGNSHIHITISSFIYLFIQFITGRHIFESCEGLYVHPSLVFMNFVYFRIFLCLFWNLLVRILLKLGVFCEVAKFSPKAVYVTSDDYYCILPGCRS